MSWLVMRHIHSAGRLALPDYQNLDMIRLLYQRTYLLLIMLPPPNGLLLPLRLRPFRTLRQQI